MLKIKKLYPDSKIPTRAYPTDSGLDLYAYLPDGDVKLLPVISKGKTITVEDIPGEGRFVDIEDRVIQQFSVTIPTGIAIELPQTRTVVLESDGTKYTLVQEAQIRGKSGLASKGIAAHWGTIDNSYTGELKIILTNIGSTEPFVISHGMKIAQLVIQTVLIPEIKIVEELANTDRGVNGFGSTGI